MIDIRITADTAVEALADLTELASKLLAADKPQHSTTPTVTSGAIPMPKTAKKEKPTPAPSVEPELEPGAPDLDPAMPETPAKGETPPAAAPEPPKALTLEVIRAAGVKAAEIHGKDKVKAVLTSLEVSGMTQLTPEQYPAFMERLGELDA